MDVPAGKMADVSDSAGDGEMSPEDEARWLGARTLADLGELTAEWLEGRVKSQPRYFGGPAPETGPLTPVLAACNRAGFVTDDSQPGEPGDEYEPQRAAVCGYMATEALSRLCRYLAGTSLAVVAHAPACQVTSDDGAIVITPSDDEYYTRAGGPTSAATLRSEYAGELHPDAIEALCSAWQVSIVDLEWGRNDVLWPALERFAAESR
jgi:hypothetical protein